MRNIFFALVFSTWFFSFGVIDAKSEAPAAFFLTLPSGARSVSLGYGGISKTSDANAIFINPAGMLVVEEWAVVGNHGIYLEDGYFDQVALILSPKRIGKIGFGFQYFTAGSIEGIDSGGNSTQKYNPNDFAVNLAHSQKLFGRFSYGVCAKYVKSTLVNSANTFSMDAAIELINIPNKRSNLALVTKNIFGSLQYRSAQNDLPRIIEIGASYQVSNYLLSVLDYHVPKYGDPYISTGLEYILIKGNGLGCSVRGGYNSKELELNGFTNFTFGVGVTRNRMSFDYAFSPMGNLGSTHWLTVGLKN